MKFLRRGNYIPDSYVVSIFMFDYEKLKSTIKVICFDLDNTLVDANSRVLEVKERELLWALKDDFKIVVMSNNSCEVLSELGFVEQISFAKKPFRASYMKVNYFKGVAAEEVLFIGDKVVTDVLGGNCFGGRTGLVDPRSSKKKKWFVHVMAVVDVLGLRLGRVKRGSYYDNL